MEGSKEVQYYTTNPAVGGLVWVWRKNGSWWPGQIIEADSSLEGVMGSGVAGGTPIKLLGREDTIVEWYNLEKCKQVKPFRCGEYKACIRRAKKAAADPTRKAVRYARREDGIIRALEIEAEQKLSADSDGEYSSAPDQIEESNQAWHRRTPNDSGDEGVKRMRGLDDLGMGSTPALKRKRTLVGHVQEFLKKKNRRRPLAKVLESTPMVPNEPKQDRVGVSCEDRTLRNGFGYGSESGRLGCNSKEKEVSCISVKAEKYSSDGLSDVPSVANGMQPAGTASNSSCQSPRVETVPLRNEELTESASTSSGAADVEEKGKSKWQLKGKRKSRTSFRTRNPDPRRAAISDDDFDDTLDEYWGWNSRRSHNFPIPTGPATSFNAPRTLPYRQSRFNMNPKYGSDFSTTNHDDDYSDLYEVNLEVKGSSGGEHVPFISLMCKSTGQPVVGYPITVEILEEGSADNLCKLNTGAKREPSSSGSERNMFVPEYKREVAPKHLKSHRVSPIKSSRLGKSATSSKKIRKLSSLTGFSKLREGARGLVAENIMDLTVACIPLKVVYSRINASLRGSMRPPRRVVKPKRR